MLEKLSVRLPNWLGDTVMAVPALRALRAALGDARILLAGPWAPLLAGQGLADVLVAHPRGGARRRIGYARGGRSWLLSDPVAPPDPRLHQADEYGLLVERLGARVADGVPRLQPPSAGSAERARARALLAEAAAHGGRGPVVGVHLGAEFGSAKVWPRERVVEFCRALRASGGSPVLLGAPADVRAAEAVRAEVPTPSLVGRDSPALLPALLAELDALVAGDTGVAHLAAALGRPVVALFGPTDPAWSAPRGPATVLARPVPCAPCFYRTCPIDHPCMRLISAERVRERVEALCGARR